LCMCFPPRDAPVPIRTVSLHPKGLLNHSAKVFFDALSALSMSAPTAITMTL
jgi:hypothetical protein